MACSWAHHEREKGLGSRDYRQIACVLVAGMTDIQKSIVRNDARSCWSIFLSFEQAEREQITGM